MLSGIQSSLARLWALEGLADQVSREWPGRGTGDAAVVFWRARWILFVVGAIGLATVLIGLVMSLAVHRPSAGTLFLTGGAILSAQLATLQAFRLWLLFQIGGWSRKNVEPVRRTEQPLKFWAWAFTSGGIVVLWGAVAGFLVWSLATSSLQS